MNNLKRLFLIINPISGTRSKQGLEETLVGRLRDKGFDVDVDYTTCSGDATQFARYAVAHDYDGVLACGGDGTVNETARAMVGTGVAMGIIPAGSGNGLARHLKIPVDPLASLEIIGERHVVDCDYGTANGQPFFCTFGVGFDAAVSDRFAASPSRGKMTYIRSALHEFLNYKSRAYRIIADGEKINDDALIVAVCNANQYGNNAYIAPDASIVDGKLDLVIVPRLPRVAMVALSMEMFAGTLSTSRLLIKRKVSKVEIMRNEPGPAHLDGESFRDAGNNITLECHPGCLKLFTPANHDTFRPVITPAQAMFQDMELTIKHLFGNT